MLSAIQLLEKYWGYKSFRPPQAQIIEAVLSRKSVMAILPTGGGKSLCYQLPALALPGMAIIVSPLIALMQDQVAQLRLRGIAAAVINNAQMRKEQEAILEQCSEGIIKLLFVSPERLLMARFKEYAAQWQISFLAVDEAHCISQWGHDFRPAYRQILGFAKEQDIQQLLAFTASATAVVRKDIASQLQLGDAPLFAASVQRPKLAYHSTYTERKLEQALILLSDTKASSIAYCRTRMKTAEAAQYLNAHHVATLIYHAGLHYTQRRQAQQQWTEAHDITMAATTAFGMGIDKPDVRQVLHLNASYSLEEYYQEAGRAGRDGLYARATLLFHQQDLIMMRRSIEEQYPPAPDLLSIYLSICNYLQIAVGDGAEQLYFFDVARFAANFKYPILKVLRTISLLAQEGYWVFNNDDSTKTTVQFSCQRQDLDNLKSYQPKLSVIATQLLRLHGSIMYYPTAISVYDDAKTIGLSFAEMDTGLKRLADIGLLQYTPAQSGSSLYMLQDRLHKDSFRLNHKRIAALKRAHRQRVEAMIAYIECNTICRSIQIAKYFGEQEAVPCGICDVCIEKSKLRLPLTNLKMYLSQNKKTSLKQLASEFEPHGTTKLHEQLNVLIREGYCIVEDNYIIYK